MAWPGWENYVPPMTIRNVSNATMSLPVPSPGHPLRLNKFNARKLTIDGHKFDSTKESKRYVELWNLKNAGEVKGFTVHPRFEFVVNGVLIGHFTPDFAVTWTSGEYTVEDVKGGSATKTEAYSLRKRLFAALYAPLTITEL